MKEKPHSKTAFTRREFIRDSIAVVSLASVMPELLAQNNSKGFGVTQVSKTAELLYPDDSFSCPREDVWPTFRTMEACSPAGDVRTRAVQYTENALKLINATGSGYTEWRFRSKSVDYAALFINGRAIRRRPERISLEVFNRSTRPVTLSFECHEMSWWPGPEFKGLPWIIGHSQVVEPGEKRVISFNFSQAYFPDRKEPQAPRYPLNAFILKAAGIDKDASYELYLKDLTVHYPFAPDVRIKSIDCPGTLQAGKDFDCRTEIEGSAGDRIIYLEMRQGPRVMWRKRLSGEEVGSGKLHVPWYLPAGEYTLGLSVGGYRVEGFEKKVQLRNSDNYRSGLASARRRMHNGRPSVFVDGKPFAWRGYSSYDYQPGPVAEFGASGTSVFIVPTCAGDHVHHVAASTWVAPDRFDFSELDERVCFSLQSNPDAYICLRVSLALPPFWVQEHEAELARVMTDQGPLIWEETGTRCASLASEAWKTEQERALREIIRHCKFQPWGKRVIAFFLTGEVTEEWFAWACNDKMFSDYSRPNQALFLRRADKNGLNVVDRNNPIPLPEARSCPGSDVYLDTVQGRLAAAYSQYLSDLTADTIIHFSKIVKDETGGSSLTGAFYGYVIQLAGESRQSTSGHFALRKLIDDPNVDFIAGIPLHDTRQFIGGCSAFPSAVESITAAGKLYYCENDLFSWLHPGLWYTEYDPKNPRAGAVSMHRREMAHYAVTGVMEGKFSLMASWHHDDELQAEFDRLGKVYDRTLKLDRSPIEEIAFVVDDTSFAWIPPESTVLHASNKQLLHRLMMTGAPMGVWLLSDIDKLPERIRFVVIAGAPAPDPRDLAKLKVVIEWGGRSVLVVGDVGLIDPVKGQKNPTRPAEFLEMPANDGDPRPLQHDGKLIWCSQPPLDTGKLLKWIKDAGVHLYAPEGFSIHASRELVSITSSDAGFATLKWPKKVTVEDMYSGWRGSGVEFSCPFDAGQTRLFRVFH